MKLKQVISASLLCMALPGFILAGTWYVSSEGSNSNPGTSAKAPLKNIQKAVDQAKNGDVIKVSEGSYAGVLNKHETKITKPVILEGGYSKDFSKRDPFTNHSIIVPKNRTITLLIEQKLAGTCAIDGFVIDGTSMNEYDGISLNYLQGSVPVISIKLIAFKEQEARITNCILMNCSGEPIYINGVKGAKFIIENNLIVNNRRGGILINPNNKADNVLIKNNSIIFSLFTHPGDTAALGHAINTDAYQGGITITKNILAHSTKSAVRNGNRNKSMSITDNIFANNGSTYFMAKDNVGEIGTADLADTDLLDSEGNKDMDLNYESIDSIAKKRSKAFGASLTMEEVKACATLKGTPAGYGVNLTVK
ncbi:MAG: right-handed parallel beta-helix repeat-containing protein [bacterium]